MKRAAAIILSLTVIWLQVLASAQTLSTPAPACPCCVAKKSCCCVEESAPTAESLPATPATASVPIDFAAILTKVIAWTLPAAAPLIASSSDGASALLSAVPLFQRNCALLI